VCERFVCEKVVCVCEKAVRERLYVTKLCVKDLCVKKLCVCVKRLNRRKTSRPTDLSLSIYISHIFITAGDHPGPGGVGDQRRHLPGTRVNVPAGLWWCTWAHLSRSWWPP